MIFRATLVWLLLAGVTFGAPQKVVIVVDDSGSMAERMRYTRQRKIAAAKQALSVVLSKLPDDAEIGVLALNNGWILPLQRHDLSQVQQRVNQLRARGGTPLGMRMKEGTDALLKLRDKEHYGDYRLIVVTDGEANDQALLNFILPDIMNRGLLVDAIGVDMASEHSLATQVHSYRKADDQASLEQAIANALAESDDSAAIGGESDFELLANFPIDVTPTVISALTSANNTPIGGQEINESDFDANSISMPNSSSGGGGPGFVFGAFFCMGVLFFVVTMVSQMFRAITRAARPRRRW